MARISEDERLFLMTANERPYWERGIFPSGMDEVGRGPLAGPVVAAAVIMRNEPLIKYVNDSKKVAEARREKLAPILKENAIAWGVSFVSEAEIDETNILVATKKAFREAFYAMDETCPVAFIDAVRGLDIPAEKLVLVHGDALSYLIAAASIIAKAERDAYMRKQAEIYPEYGFERNKGYGTAEHIAALRKYGACPIHRRSFIGGILS